MLGATLDELAETRLFLRLDPEKFESELSSEGPPYCSQVDHHRGVLIGHDDGTSQLGPRAEDGTGLDPTPGCREIGHGPFRNRVVADEHNGTVNQEPGRTPVIH